MYVIKLCFIVVKMIIFIYRRGKNSHLFVHLLTVQTNQNQWSRPVLGRTRNLILSEQTFQFPKKSSFCITSLLWTTFQIILFLLHTLILKTRSCRYLLLVIDSLTSTRLLALVKVLKCNHLKFSICMLRLVYVSCTLKPSNFLCFILIFEEYLLTCWIKK